MNGDAHNTRNIEMESIYEPLFEEICTRMVYLAKEMEQAFGRAKALELIGKGNERGLVELKKNQLDKESINNFEDFKKFWKKSTRSPFISNIVIGTISEETPDKIVSHITECMWAKTFKEMNALDLGYIMCCHPDFATGRLYHPKIKFNRTKTLMQGDNYCNHTFYWEE
jgi:hypothetical protein